MTWIRGINMVDGKGELKGWWVKMVDQKGGG